MRLSSFLPAVFAALAAATAVPRAPSGFKSETAARAISANTTSLAVVAGPPLTFSYSTPDPDSKNWIGIWNDYYGGPDNQTSVANSLAWNWADKAQGSVQVDVSKLQAGRYKAYFLAKGGYKWLADPIEVFVPGTGPLEFLIKNLTTQHARVGDAFVAVVSGLLANPKDENTTYAVINRHCADWVSISKNGTITGKPTARGLTKFTVAATGSDGSVAHLPVTVPVVNAKDPLVEKLKVLTFNIWQGGKNVNDYHRKQLNFLTGIDADVVGMQESFFRDGLRLAKALGWYVWQSNDASIISRYPIVEVYPQVAAGGAVRIAVDGEDSQIIMYNAHLGYDPYGPYDFCFSHYDKAKVLEREAESGRTPQIIEIMGRMKPQIANYKDVPVILTGDFNAPSHLDWTNATAKQHCGVGDFGWPSSVHPIEGGLIDSFREMHPDPVKTPGITWSPIYLKNNNRDEPMDRIDFIYHKGMKTLSSEVVLVGNPTPEPNHKNNEWTSDHAAVLSTFKIPNKRQQSVQA